MSLDWTKCAAVESVPGKVSGAWVFRGTRLPVATIFENLEDGLSIEEIMEQFDVTREQVTALLDFAARTGSSDSPLMLILFDHGTPRGISRALQGHIVKEALSNGDLLKAAEEAGFEVLLTTDTNLPHQQNLKDANWRS
jgi:uncharacterized protein (DUF433 family)